MHEGRGKRRLALLTRLAATVATATVVLLDARALAQERPRCDPPLVEEQCRQLRPIRDEAFALFEQGQYARASERFQQLQRRLQEHGSTRHAVAFFMIGRCLMQLAGREADAIAAFERYLEGTSQLAQIDEQIALDRSQAVDLLAEMRARLPADSPSRELAAPDRAAPAATPAMGTTISPVGPILLATGGAALVAAAILGGVVLAQEGSLTSSCSGAYCPERARGLAAEVETLAITTDVLLLAGAAVTATGLVLSFALHDEAPALSAACGPSGCVLSGRF